MMFVGRKIVVVLFYIFLSQPRLEWRRENTAVLPTGWLGLFGDVLGLHVLCLVVYYKNIHWYSLSFIRYKHHEFHAFVSKANKFSFTSKVMCHHLNMYIGYVFIPL